MTVEVLEARGRDLVSFKFTVDIPVTVYRYSFTMTRYQWRRCESNMRRANQKDRRKARGK